MSLKGLAGSFVALLAVAFAVLYQQSPVVRLLLSTPTHGYTDNSGCTHIQGAQACEKIVLHRESGLLYLACSTPAARLRWAPFFEVFTEASPATDHIALYDHTKKNLKKLTLENFKDNRGLHVHGLDVVQDKSDPSLLWIYAINHRPQREAGTEHHHGADSVVEIFKTTPGGNSLTHVTTVKDPSVIITPNDVSGSSDGQSFFVTNDNPSRVNKWDRAARLWFARPSTSVGYCHVKSGCKIVADGIIGANGIVKTDEDTIWVAGAIDGKLRSYTRQADNTLVLTDVVNVGPPLDNLSTDGKGNIYVGVLVGDIHQVFKYLKDPYNLILPGSVYNISLNSGRDAYFGEKYSVKKIFEDDGSVISSITTGAYDPKAKTLYIGGLMALSTVACPV